MLIVAIRTENAFELIFVSKDGVHDPIIDARSALKLYLLVQTQWEESINHRKCLELSLTTEEKHESGVASSNRFNVLNNHGF